MTVSKAAIGLALFLMCALGLAFLKWTHSNWRHLRLRPAGWSIWLACLVFGLVIGFSSNELPRGKLRFAIGIVAVLLSGGALGFMGLYIGWLMSLGGEQAKEWLFKKLKL